MPGPRHLDDDLQLSWVLRTLESCEGGRETVGVQQNQNKPGNAIRDQGRGPGINGDRRLVSLLGCLRHVYTLAWKMQMQMQIKKKA